MLKYFLLALLTGISVHVHAQGLSLKDLEAPIGKSMTYVSDSLINKGWKLNAGLTGSFETDYYRTFSYGNLESDASKALAWIRIHTERTAVNRIYYQAPDKEAYEALLKEIEALQAVKLDTQLIENQTVTVFKGKNYVYQGITADQSFTIVVISPSFYQNHTAAPKK